MTNLLARATDRLFSLLAAFMFQPNTTGPLTSPPTESRGTTVKREPVTPPTPPWGGVTGRTGSRLAAWDCLFTDLDPGHVCREPDGTPFAPGGTCHVSADLLSKPRVLARAYPVAYANAVKLGLLTEEVKA